MHLNLLSRFGLGQPSTESPLELQAESIEFGIYNGEDTPTNSSFNSTYTGRVVGVRLQYESGGVRCRSGIMTNWGCHTELHGPSLGVFIINADGERVYPDFGDPRGFLRHSPEWYTFGDGPYNRVDGDILELRGKEVDVEVDQNFEVVYTAHFYNRVEEGNEGRVQAKVWLILRTFT